MKIVYLCTVILEKVIIVVIAACMVVVALGGIAILVYAIVYARRHPMTEEQLAHANAWLKEERKKKQLKKELKKSRKRLRWYYNHLQIEAFIHGWDI